jgi:rSAM/selenodomain-associated transferase 1
VSAALASARPAARRPVPATTAALVVLAKAPEPGRVKTRLCPPCTPDQAAALAAAALDDTLDAVRSASVRAVLVLEAADGTDRARWRRPGLPIVPQRGDRLDERLAAAFEDVGGPALLVGMDTPQVTPGLLRRALDRLTRTDVDAVLGHAADGGFWAIGLREPDPRAFLGVPMSTDHTGAAQHARLHSLGLRVGTLAVLRDVDTAADAHVVAAAAPHTRFARAAGRILGTSRLHGEPP